MSSSPGIAWSLLLLGPLLFLLAIVSASVLVGTQGTAPAEIPDRVARLMPEMLLAVQLGLGAAILLSERARQRLPFLEQSWTPSRAGTDLLLGVAAGGLLALLYLRWLAPLLVLAQRSLGDYVPPGELLPTVSRSIWIFFAANVLLAPLVEEIIYRGYAIPALAERFGVPAAILLSCLCFGLLHWPGGGWYMLLTGTVAGGAFAGLFVWRGGLLSPFAAHLTLNAVEFVHAWSLQRSDASGG